MEKNIFNIYYDEAGRGPLAGPVFIGLICPIKKLSKKELLNFCDSKEVSETKREKLYSHIENLKFKGKIISCTARATATEIDNFGITNALHCAILRGMIQIFNKIFPKKHINYEIPNPLSTKTKSNLKYSNILNYFSELNSQGIHIKLIMDGNSSFGLKKTFPFWEIETIISGDAKVKEIGMASIIAKVSRDYIMKSLPKKYTKYKFEKHKGYGTKEHKELLKKYGPCDIHRKLFLKWIFPNHKISKEIPTIF